MAARVRLTEPATQDRREFLDLVDASVELHRPWTYPPADAASDPTWTKLVAFSDEIQVEDIEICERVQKNLRSRSYDRGRYSPTRENGVHHFHSLLHEFLT